MNLVDRLNSDVSLRDLRITSRQPRQFEGLIPVTATPAAFAAGLAGAAAVAAAAAAGAAIGQAVD
jgi:hypothetical protein